MAEVSKFDVWIYRPDVEATMRKINRNFVYNGRGKVFWDVFEQKKDLNRQINDILEKTRQQPKTKIEVPND